MTYHRGLGAVAASDFETMRPGAWTGAGVDPNLNVDPSQWNPTLSADPVHIAQVNQMLASGTNPATGQQTALLRAALARGYRWENGGNLINPYTLTAVGNAFDLGAAGISALPVAVNVGEAWSQLDVYARSKGYTLENTGGVKNLATSAIDARIPSYDEIARRGQEGIQVARDTLERLPLAQQATTSTPVLPPPPAAPRTRPPPPPPPSGPPPGWKYNGENGWWGPDGMFYAGDATATPWINGQGVSVSTFSPPTNAAPTVSPFDTTPVTEPINTFADTGGGATAFPGGIITEYAPTNGTPAPTDAPAMAGFGGKAAILIGLGLLGAWLVTRKR